MTEKIDPPAIYTALINGDNETRRLCCSNKGILCNLYVYQSSKHRINKPKSLHHRAKPKCRI